MVGGRWSVVGGRWLASGKCLTSIHHHIMSLFVTYDTCNFEAASLLLGIFEPRKAPAIDSNSNSASALPLSLVGQTEMYALHGPEVLTIMPPVCNGTAVSTVSRGTPSSMHLSFFRISSTPTFL